VVVLSVVVELVECVALNPGLHPHLVPRNPESPFQTKFYSERTHGKYSCKVYLEHLAQELGGQTQSIVAFETFISVLQNPDIQSDKTAVSALTLLDPMSDENIPHETWLNLLYSCTVAMPDKEVSAKLKQFAPYAYTLLRPFDTVLQRIVKLGMVKTLMSLRNKGLYDEGHFFHSRDEEGNSLFHLAVLGRSPQVARQLAETLGANTIHLLSGSYSFNKQQLRPWDLAKKILDYGMMELLNGLYEVYRTDDGEKHQVPLKPPKYTLPDIRVIEKTGYAHDGVGGGGGIQLPPGWHTGNQNTLQPTQYDAAGGDGPTSFGGSAVASAGVMRDVIVDDLAKANAETSRTLWVCLGLLGVMTLLGIVAWILFALCKQKSH